MRSIYDALGKLATLGFPLDFAPSETIPAAPQQTAGPAAPAVDVEALRASLLRSMDAKLAEHLAHLKPVPHATVTSGAGADAFERYGLVPCDVVVGGASVGLPGQSRRLFDDGNFEALFRGENRIDRLDPKWAAKFIEKDIVRLVKDAGEPRMERVTQAIDIIKLAGRKGDLDVVKDYDVDAKLAKTLDITSKMAIAAALEALHDAGIPLVREQIKTTTGKLLPGGWVLPAHMQNDTGIVFASAFPGYDNFVQEISTQLAKKYATATLKELNGLYHELLTAVPQERRQELSRFYAEHAHELQRMTGSQAELATFNRHFLFAILSLGHAELAEHIHARGPNTQVNAACSSSTQAIAIAEDWLRTGRCRRVLVVGADDVTSENMLEWIGSGFLASGAATTAPSVEEGALPFDKRRHGMIIGSGAVGLVIERAEDVAARGMIPVARLVATRVANSAYHGSRLHVDHIAGEAHALVETAANRLHTSAEALGPQTIFVSHETYTPARGGSASAEAAAMRRAFGAGATKVLVANTKGFTGHAMGAGLEDALAVKALQFNKVPPIANLREVDPEFADLALSKGGSHERKYAMRFSAGFGSQLALAFFEKMADGPHRISDVARYQAFLDRAAGTSGAKAERVGRVLRITNASASSATHTLANVKPPEPVQVPMNAPAPAPASLPPPASAPSPAPSRGQDVRAQVIALVSEKTGYPPDMLDPNLDMEADLGIDTVKQAEIFGQLREQFGIPKDESLTLKQIPTLGKVADYFASRMGSGAAPPGVPADPSPPVASPAPALQRTTPVSEPARVAEHAPATAGNADEIMQKVTAMIAAKTGYPPEMLDATLDMEADLGIDTVKQAEIFGEVRETFGIPKIEGINLKDYPTIRHVAGFVSTHAGRTPAAQAPSLAAPVIDLPQSAAITRRVPRVVESPHEGHAARSAFVVGHGPLMEAARHRHAATTGEVAIFEGSARELFVYAKGNAAALEAGKLGILSVSHLGGTHGIDRAANAADGGVTGATKALAQEFPLAWIRALDLDPEEDVAARMRAIDAELKVDKSLVEVGRARGRRIVVETIEAGPTTGARPQLRPDSVILVTGGARGITAEILKALAPQRPTLVLLGRTAAPTAADAALDEPGLRERSKAELAAKGERVTPVNIEKWIAPFRARHEIWRTLRELEAAGAKAHYAAVDVSDAAALSHAVAFARSHGRITGVIHASGVEESKKLADKDEAAFDRAWRPKAQAALELAKLVESDKPDFFVMFGSVAGRYGNAAQVDYSAANDCMAKLARVLRGKGIAASVFAWGPWGEVGMATKGSTLTVLKSMGVDSISTSEGVGAFLSELARLDEPEVVLAKSLGALAQSPRHGARLTLRASDAALNDHRVDGVPFMPGVLGLQAFADAAGSVHGFEDVHWAYPVKLLRDQDVEASVSLAEAGAKLTTVPPGPLKQERTHFTARLLHAPAPPPAPASAQGAAWTWERIYPPFFHGPAFHVLKRATRIGFDGIEVEGRKPAAGISEMAATLEGALQSLGLWGLAVGRSMALPERVRRVTLHGLYDTAATMYRVTDARLAEGRVLGDVQCLAHGKVVASLEGVSLIVTGPASIDESPPLWGSDEVAVGGARVTRVRVAEARALLARPERLALVLGPQERAALSTLTVEKRREEWLAATLAAKLALRKARDQRPWSAMEILRGSDGAPLLHGAWGLTMSHAAGVALAVAFDSARERVGVDVESIEWRAASFEDEAFTHDERAQFPTGPGRETAVTMAWAAKEATLKALGVGLSIPLSSLRVKTNGAVQVEMAGAAKERFAALDGDALSVDARREGATAVALARIRLAKRG
ncbi:MAG TPA: SDR family NAD(P)-dependent oxidoreductase [Candidatus Thermoplasmatota archaeon]|nr:SDR family NAD(P)-dependent oxidoreductase [Candidatus Thermoplasmatota archaeon]